MQTQTQPLLFSIFLTPGIVGVCLLSYCALIMVTGAPYWAVFFYVE